MKYIYYVTLTYVIRGEIKSMDGVEVSKDKVVSSKEDVDEIREWAQSFEPICKIYVTGLFLLRTEEA